MARPPKKLTTKKSIVKKSSTSKPTAQLPGYFKFSREVLSLLVVHRRVFLRLLILTVVVLLFVVGTSQNSQYMEFASSTKEISAQISTGVTQYIIEVGAVLISVIGGSYVSTLSEGPQIYLGIIYLMLWLVSVWLLRNLLAGSKVNVRDGLYNANGALISTALIIVVGIVQLLPFAIFVSLLSLVNSNGAVSGVLTLMIGIILLVLLFVLTIYWLIGTLFAAVVVTIPGTYPVGALRSAKELIAGHRAKVFKRILWLFLMYLLALVGLILPVVAIDVALGYALSFVVTVWVQLVYVSLFLYSAAYIYVLYRRIIDERTN